MRSSVQIDSPLGAPYVSQQSGKVFMSSDLGFVDTFPGYGIADALPPISVEADTPRWDPFAPVRLVVERDTLTY